MAEVRDLDDRLNSALAWLITGNTVEAAKICGVPDRTIRDWMTKDWWEAILQEARATKQKELDAVWTRIIHKAAEAINDRLTEGDPVLTKMGEIRRIPVKAKDLSFILSVITDKRNLARGEPTSRSEKRTVEESLKNVADRLESFDSPTKSDTKDISIKH